jgi:hypothetical protein
MRLFRHHRFSVLAGAALLLASSGGVASAQSLPGVPMPDPNGQVEQIMLAGEADAVAQYLDISTDQLRGELAGQSLAQVTRRHGKSVSEVTKVVVNAANQQLAAAVEQGQLDADTAGRYSGQLALFAPLLVNSPEATALALQASAS